MQLTSELRIGAGYARAFYLIRLQLNSGVRRLTGFLANESIGAYIVSTMPRSNSVKARIVAIGNSQGVRIPKPLLEHAGIGGEVELHAENGRIVIAAARRARAGWAEAAAQLHARGEDGLIVTPAPAFDAEDWEWR